MPIYAIFMQQLQLNGVLMQVSETNVTIIGTSQDGDRYQCGVTSTNNDINPACAAAESITLRVFSESTYIRF